MAALPVTAALAAAQAGTLGIGLSGSGFLLPFFLGVIDVLQRQLGVLTPATPVAGASGGSIAIMAINGLLPLETMRDEVERLSEYCGAHGNCFGTLQSEVRAAADRMLPANAADAANRHGRTYIAVTFPSPDGSSPAVQELVGSFSGRDDLLDAGAASVYVPMWAGPRVTTTFRGRPAYDGSFAGPGEGWLPCPPNVTYCVRVSSLPAGGSLGGFIADEIRQGSQQAMAQVASLAASTLFGSNMPINVASLLMSRAEAGPAAAAAEPLQLQQLYGALSAAMTPGEGEADIWPGRRHKMPASKAVWSTWMLAPPSAEQRQEMFDLGRAEALSWAEEAGLVTSSSKKARKPATRRMMQ